jgi:hypothetical protein
MIWHYTVREPNFLTAWAGINLRDRVFFFSAQEVKKFDDITTRAIQTNVDKLETLGLM